MTTLTEEQSFPLSYFEFISVWQLWPMATPPLDRAYQVRRLLTAGAGFYLVFLSRPPHRVPGPSGVSGRGGGGLP